MLAADLALQTARSVLQRRSRHLRASNPAANLASLAAERGDHGESRDSGAEVLAECPGDREALDHLEKN